METPNQQQPTLTALFRLEPGCLGPNGVDFAYAFCEQFQEELHENSSFIDWQVEPRFDKSLPETEYFFQNRPITQAQAQKLVASFKGDLDSLEMNMHDHLAESIDQFLAGN